MQKQKQSPYEMHQDVLTTGIKTSLDMLTLIIMHYSNKMISTIDLLSKIKLGKNKLQWNKN